MPVKTKQMAKDADGSLVESPRWERLVPIPNFLDLNDDCLSEIMSYLYDVDLSALNHCCRRLGSLTEDHVRRKYAEEVMGRWKSTQYTLQSGFLWDFGRVMTRLHIIKGSTAEIFLCKNFTNLQELTVTGITFSPTLVDRTEALRQNLRHLAMGGCHSQDDGIRQFIVACANLKSLTVSPAPEFQTTPFPSHHYPTVREISIRYDGIQASHTAEFLKKNPQIESATLCLLNLKSSATIYAALSNHSVSIKKICGSFWSNDDFLPDAIQLHRLDGLVELDIDWGYQCIASVIDALAAKNRLETLGLFHAQINSDLIDSLCKLTNLKMLKLERMYRDIDRDYVKRLSAGLRSLNSLFYFDDVCAISLDRNAFPADVIFFVEFFPQLQSLTLKYWYYRGLNGPQFLQISAARKQSKAEHFLTIFLKQFEFRRSIANIPKVFLEREMGHIQLVSDKNLDRDDNPLWGANQQKKPRLWD